MVIMRPTSIVVAGAGSSASVRAAGGVEFASATSLSLNGVFTADFDDYMIVCRHTATAQQNISIRLRDSTPSDASGSNYTTQFLQADSTTVSGGRTTYNTGYIAGQDSTARAGFTVHAYGPNLAQPTAVRSVTGRSYLSATIEDWAWTHSLSTAYVGFTLIAGAGNISGLITVYGLAQ